jgi:hypothetical protein
MTSRSGVESEFLLVGDPDDENLGKEPQKTATAGPVTGRGRFTYPPASISIRQLQNNQVVSQTPRGGHAITSGLEPAWEKINHKRGRTQ